MTRLHRYTDEQVARVCHDVVTSLQAVQGDPVPSGPWISEPPERRKIVIEMVRSARAGVTPRESHANWVREMTAIGWSYGPVKDPVAKTHPNLREYRDLDQFQRDKDRVCLAVVTALTLED